MGDKFRRLLAGIRHNRRTRAGLVLVLIVLGVLVAVWMKTRSRAILGPDTQDFAMVIGRRAASGFLLWHGGDMNQVPTAQYFKKSATAAGGPMWVVGFKYPAPKDYTGKMIGSREFWGFAVYLNMDGKVVNSMIQSP